MNVQQRRYYQAQTIVNVYLKGSIAVGLIPVPLVDTALLLGAQFNMTKDLAKIYKIEFSEHQVKSIIASLLGTIVPLSLTANLFSLSKSIPLVGQAVGILGMPILGGASTYAVGQVFIQHFEAGGTLLDFNPVKMRAYYKQQFEQGKQAVKKSYAGIRP